MSGQPMSGQMSGMGMAGQRLGGGMPQQMGGNGLMPKEGQQFDLKEPLAKIAMQMAMNQMGGPRGMQIPAPQHVSGLQGPGAVRNPYGLR